ncbi:polysaccharide lyase [Stachybotrys elegans]|uniref:Polysaccharide lyase n=1 Tax=Stachybotrys elegans TaxID=80388 RepID=A0A8K0WV66_9HYPO|nr:polysaccharide lyase [Stachybotrys elegans]
MVSIKSLILAVATLPLASQATRIFYNQGTLSGWDNVFQEHNGRVSERTNVVYSGSSALKMEQTFDPSYNGRYHSEVRHNNGYRRNDNRYYGFAFRLSEGWQFQTQSYNIAQFIARRPGAGCGGDDFMPSTMVWIEGNRLKTRYVNGPYSQPNCNRGGEWSIDVGEIAAGAWHTVVIHMNWRSDSSGAMEVWLDGSRTVSRSGVATTTSDDFTFEFRVGLYANGWFDRPGMVGSQGFREIWMDEIAIGTTYADVNPRG